VGHGVGKADREATASNVGRISRRRPGRPASNRSDLRRAQLLAECSGLFQPGRPHARRSVGGPAARNLIYLVTVVVTTPQTLVFALIAEFFLLRNALVHVLFGAAAAAGGSFLFWPQSPQDMDAGRWADIGIIAAAGLVAGMVYWLIAGRDAGFRRPFTQP
jgi:hypothetical protein